MQISACYPITKGDYTRAGEASADIKRQLRQLGIEAAILRRISVASYEVELNIVIHSFGGELCFEVQKDRIVLETRDTGPGIEDINLAMSEGYSTADEEARSLGFGAGMGLPNMRRNADEFDIKSVPGTGTTIRMVFLLKPAA